jgi:hypothetical protein
LVVFLLEKIIFEIKIKNYRDALIILCFSVIIKPGRFFMQIYLPVFKKNNYYFLSTINKNNTFACTGKSMKMKDKDSFRPIGD